MGICTVGKLERCGWNIFVTALQSAEEDSREWQRRRRCSSLYVNIYFCTIRVFYEQLWYLEPFELLLRIQILKKFTYNQISLFSVFLRENLMMN